MIKLLSHCIFFFAILLFFSGCSISKQSWQEVFNGRDLSDFEVLNGTAEFVVEDGIIVGRSQMNTPNTFLGTRKKYGDFILEFEVLADTLLNSGVQFRSTSDPKIKDGRVHGYQVEIESSPRKWAGGVYDEARRGWLYPLKDNPKGQAAFKPGTWNHYRVEAIGANITTWVNEVLCARLIDDKTLSGIIAFQVHSIEDAQQENRLVKWRNIRIQTEGLKPRKIRKKEAIIRITPPK